MIITKTIIKKRTKWLNLKQSFYLSKTGKSLSWYFVERKNNPHVVTIIVRSLKTEKYLFIEQVRIPVQNRVIEFPAGLVDEGETIEEAGLRELKEETGYDNVKIQFISPLAPKSAGLTNESAAFVFCTIEDEKHVGRSNMEESEDIVYHWMNPDEFNEYINQHKDVMVANDVMAYMMQYMIT